MMLHEIHPQRTIDWQSYSGLTLHRACPQAFSYRYLYGLSKPMEDDPKVEARFGTLWHALRAADAIERGRALGTLKFFPETLFVAEGAPEVDTREDDLMEQVIAIAYRWGDNLPFEHAELWNAKLGEQPGPRLRTLNDRFTEQWYNERWNESPIAVEVKWVRQIPGAEVELLGYADEVYFDQRRNLTVVRDHKTSKSMSTQTTSDDMMDSQLHLYAWGLADLVKEWGIPAVQAVAFDRVRSVKPTEPQLTAKTKKLSARITQYDLATYLDFVQRTEDYEAEESVLEHLKSPSWQSNWFQRTLTPLNRNLMRAHLQAAVDTNTDAQRTVDRVNRRGEAPRNLTGAACKFCDFAKLCRAQMIGGVDGEYELAEYGLQGKESK